MDFRGCRPDCFKPFCLQASQLANLANEPTDLQGWPAGFIIWFLLQLPKEDAPILQTYLVWVWCYGFTHNGEAAAGVASPLQ